VQHFLSIIIYGLVTMHDSGENPMDRRGITEFGFCLVDFQEFPPVVDDTIDLLARLVLCWMTGDESNHMMVK